MTLLGERLHRVRRDRFVGRGAELDAFRHALAAPRQSPPIMFVHGPGGTGKTALLEMMAGIAADAGITAHQVSASTPDESRAALLRAVGDVPQHSRLVLLVDDYERLAPLDEWMRETFLAALPDDALVVLAGRLAPGSAWAADPAWRDLVVVVRLLDLTPDEQLTYLVAEGVDPHARERLLALSHGHPLALSLLVDRVLRGAHTRAGVPRRLTDAPDVLRALLARIVDPPPTPRHAHALQICAHARFTTEDLLAAVLPGSDDDALGAARLFQWLRTLPYVDESAFGLQPVDIVRDVLDADLQWRHSDDYEDLHRRVRACVVGQAALAASGPDLQRRIGDAIFVARGHPQVGELLRLGPPAVEPAEPISRDDRAAVVELTARRQGVAQARMVEHWLSRQPGAFRIFRTAGGAPAGYAALLALDEATEADLAIDPGARAMWGYAVQHGRPRAGESVLAWRFLVIDEQQAVAGRGLSPATLLALLVAWRAEEGMARSAVSWEFVGCFDDDAPWAPLLAYLNFGRAAAADHNIDGRRYPVFGHDWRRVGLAEWLELTQARELGQPAAAPHCHESDRALAEADFGAAVRDALRNLHEPLALRGNALLDSRLVREQAGRDQDPVDVLREVLTTAADRLRSDPRRESEYHAFDRTFLRPASTQERAAKALDMSFSTYRRRRDRAVQRIVDLLWQREIGGAT